MTRTELTTPRYWSKWRVEDERLQRRVGIADRRRDALDDGVEQLVDALAGLGADAQDLVGGDAEHLLDLVGVPVGVGRRQVDLVEGGDDLEVVLEGEVAVGERLGLDPLGGVDEEDGALAGGQAAAHLVAEVDVAGRVDEVEDVVAFQSSRTDWSLIVMPRSRSMSIESRYCSRMSRGSTAPHRSRMRSDSVVLPWSMWAMMRDSAVGADRSRSDGPSRSHDGRRAVATTADSPCAAGSPTVSPYPGRRGTEPTTRGSVANIKSQIKRNQQNAARHERNKAVRSELKTRVKRRRRRRRGRRRRRRRAAQAASEAPRQGRRQGGHPHERRPPAARAAGRSGWRPQAAPTSAE